MRKGLGFALNLFLVLAIAIATLWGVLAIWYQLPFPGLGRTLAVCAFGLLGCGVIVAIFSKRRATALGLWVCAFAGVVLWWSTIRPPAEGDWSADVARQVTGQFDGDILTLTNVREFEWRSEEDVAERWTTRRYDLGQLQTLDLFLSYWAGPEMAHFILSFGFADGEYLAWSVEVRRRVGGGFSPLADFFKSNNLVTIAAVEQDVVGVRSNVRREDVQIFRLRTPPEVARTLLREYVSEANDLARMPLFYNSLTTNCTTVVFKMMSAIGRGVPLDWRVVMNGYLPDYLHDIGAIETDMPVSELRDLGRIAPRALPVGLGKAFSAAIRQGVPRPG